MLNTPEIKFKNRDQIQRQGLDQKVLLKENVGSLAARAALEQDDADVDDPENIAETINQNSPAKGFHNCRIPKLMEVKKAKLSEDFVMRASEDYLD